MAVIGKFFEHENTPESSGDYPGRIGGDYGMIAEMPNFIGDYRKILRGELEFIHVITY